MRYAPLFAIGLLCSAMGCHGAGRGGPLGFGILGSNSAPAGTVYAPPAYATAPTYAAAPAPQVIQAAPQIIAQPAPQPVIVQQMPQQMVQPANYYQQGNCCQPCPCQ